MALTCKTAHRQSSLSEEIAHYLFGYWNSFTLEVEFGKKCDKKGTRYFSCAPGSWYFPAP